MSTLSLIQGIRRASALLSCLIAIAALAPSRAQGQVNVIPTQFVAKMYTEALGRAPDQTGWAIWTSYFASNGCSLSTLQSVATGFYTSSEFTNDYSDNQSMVLTLYRGLLNRDPDQTGFNNWISSMNSGTSWATVVSSFEGSSEFSGEVATICSATTPDYGFGGAFTPPTTTPIGSGFTGTEAALQTALNSASSGSNVCIAQAELITLNTPLIVPSGVTLSTCGNPPTTQYAHMARLARGSTFTAPNVEVDGGGSLESVWVDGQRNNLGYAGQATNYNIEALGGTNTNVSSNKSAEPQGGSALFSDGSVHGYPCASLTVENNLVTAYTAEWGTQPSDGLTMQCENTTVSGNNIVDVVDCGIILFTSPNVAQQSQVTNNTIVSAGNNTSAALVADEFTGSIPPVSFSGALFSNNVFWTGPYTHFTLGIAAGTRPWFSSSVDFNANPGPTFTNNWTGSFSANVRAGIAVSGILNVDITNDGDHPLNANVVNFQSGIPASGCPGGTVIADTSDGNASGTFPTPVYTGDFDDCINSTVLGANYSLANSSWGTSTLNGWMPYVAGPGGSSSDVYVQFTTSGYNGDAYELVLNDASNSFNVGADQVVMGLTPGTVYTAAVYAETAPSSSGGYIMLQDGNGTHLNYTNIPGNVSSWTQYATSATVNSTGMLEVDLGSNEQSANAWTYFDSASLTLQ